MEDFDLVVIGAGPGGYVAAIRAAQLGKKTAIIEKEELGGICLNWGCIPTKSLLKSAELYNSTKKLEDYGINISGKITFDLKKIVSRSRDISDKLVSGIGSLLKKNKITLIKGTAKLSPKKDIIIDNKQTIKAKNIIIATGARAKIIKNFEPNQKNIWTYKEALIPKSIPKSITIVGAGAIGMEFASFYNALGCDVTVLEADNQILRTEDQEIAQQARKLFEKANIKIKTGVKLKSQKLKNNLLEIVIEDQNKDHTILSEILLMATGVVANIENLGLEHTSIKFKDGHIITNGFMETNEKNIYAIGDVTAPPWLAHKASHEGIIAAETIAGKKAHMIKESNIPACIYSSPQIASVGLTEEQAIKAGYKINVGKFPSYANPKAMILNDADGLVKTIFDAKNGELLGAHMIGTNVTELIHSYVIAKELETTEIEIMNSIFPHPTLSEMIHESVLGAHKRSIHI